MSRVTEAMKRASAAAVADVPKTQPFGPRPIADADGPRLDDYPREGALPSKKLQNLRPGPPSAILTINQLA